MWENNCSKEQLDSSTVGEHSSISVPPNCRRRVGIHLPIDTEWQSSILPVGCHGEGVLWSNCMHWIQIKELNSRKVLLTCNNQCDWLYSTAIIASEHLPLVCSCHRWEIKENIWSFLWCCCESARMRPIIDINERAISHTSEQEIFSNWHWISYLGDGDFACMWKVIVSIVRMIWNKYNIVLFKRCFCLDFMYICSSSWVPSIKYIWCTLLQC